MITLMAVASKIFNFIKLHWKVVLAALLGAIFVLKAQGCYHKLFPSKQPISAPSTPNLPKGDKEVITVNDTNHTTSIANGKGTTVVSGSRQTTIEIKDNGQVVVKEKTLGLCLNPMIGFGGNNTGIKGIVAAELAYYKKLDLIGGIGADKYIGHTSVFIAIGYTPNNKFFHNTSFWIGPSIDTTASKGVMAGVAVRI